MDNAQSQREADGPKAGDTRFADDGTLEAFDGRSWMPYLPARDSSDQIIYKMHTVFNQPDDDDDE
jgi:hypothetical protein